MRLGFVYRWLAKALARRTSVILCYHGIGTTSAAEDPDFLRVPEDRFTRQVGLLRDAGFTFVTVAEPLRANSPPPTDAPLPLNVQFVTVAAAPLSRPPPLPPTAVFPFSVLCVSVSVPPAFAIPPPSVAMLLSIVSPLSVAVPPFHSAPPAVVASANSAKFVVSPPPPTVSSSTTCTTSSRRPSRS